MIVFLSFFSASYDFPSSHISVLVTFGSLRVTTLAFLHDSSVLHYFMLLKTATDTLFCQVGQGRVTYDDFDLQYVVEDAASGIGS